MTPRRTDLRADPPRSPAEHRQAAAGRHRRPRWQQTALGELASNRVGVVVATASVALVMRLATVAHFRTADETAWLNRSTVFSQALASGHFGDASATSGGLATMPGVTTMWIGSLARLLWSTGRRLGLWANDTATFAGTRSGLAVAQAVAAAASAVLIGLLVLLLCVWVGRAAAAVAGTLLATEPFLVAHGSVLHTDELLALLGVAALVATAIALGVPENNPWVGRPPVAALAGVLLGAALLTKVSAVMFVPSVGLLVAWAVVRAVRGRGDPRACWRTPAELRLMARWWSAGAAGIVLVSYPALWTDPVEEFGLLGRSANLAATGHLTFFLGQPTPTPGPLYYLVALPLRMTPWFLLAGVVAAVAVWCRRRWRGFAAAATCMTVPPLVVLSTAAKQFDRYGLCLVVVAAVLIGIAAAGAVRALPHRLPGARRPAVAGALLAALLAGHSLAVAPWGLAYFNPLLGGSATGERAVLVGWGEGLERAGAIIARREAGRCESVIIRSFRIPTAYPCGKVIYPGSQKPTYIVVYVLDRQRVPTDRLARLVRGYQLVGVVEIRGIRYAEVYGPGETAERERREP